MVIKEIPYQQTYLVFVYCTFKKGYYNHASRMKSAKFISKSRTSKGYALYANHQLWPFMIEESDGNGVSGELYQVDRKTLESMYDRKCDLNERFWLKEVVLEDRDIFTDEPVYAFFHTPPEHGEKIESGEYSDTSLKIKHTL